MAGNTNQSGFPAVVIWVLGGTVLLGATLLFLVQPLVSKAILPWFGGSPAVWTTCMLFFQAVLLGGYIYAHLVQRWLSARGQVVLHVLAATAALFMLPIVASEDWRPGDDSNPTSHILLLLGATVGLPYLVLSGTSPLVQKWFSYAYPGRSPYRLYAVSNFGSLAALLSYPLLVERVFDLPGQSLLWSWCFVGYAVLCGASLICLWYWDPPEEPAATAPGSGSGSRGVAAESEVAGWRRQILWIALPAVASLMLLATTNHVCQDVAVVPLLWVVPLALYLLSFIVCFDHPRWYVRKLWPPFAAFSVLLVAVGELFHKQLSFVNQVALYFPMLFLVCMVCHGELARLRPHPRRLTEYYLLIAAGGAMGGLLVSVVAPAVFNRYTEWTIGLVVSLIVACVAVFQEYGQYGGRAFRSALRSIIALGATLSVLAVIVLQLPTDRPLLRMRSFYGIISVYHALDGPRDQPIEVMALKHGWITHGVQPVEPEKRHWATAYYGESSGMGWAIRHLQQQGPVRIGAVGLGTGTVATYARAGDYCRFYEINPQVVWLAENPEYFTYVTDCRQRTGCDVVLGDARLSLARELQQQSPQGFDVLVLDAFSGDAIPVHLLTGEAFQIYLAHLKPGGILAVHVSNRYLDLEPVVLRLALEFGLYAGIFHNQTDEEKLVYSSTWILLTADEGTAAAMPKRTRVNPDDSSRAPLWTDHYSNLLQVLRWPD